LKGEGLIAATISEQDQPFAKATAAATAAIAAAYQAARVKEEPEGQEHLGFECFIKQVNHHLIDAILYSSSLEGRHRLL